VIKQVFKSTLILATALKRTGVKMILCDLQLQPATTQNPEKNRPSGSYLKKTPKNGGYKIKRTKNFSL